MKKPDKNTAEFMVQGLDLALAELIKKCPVSEPIQKGLPLDPILRCSDQLITS